MRILVIGFPLPNPQIDNYDFIRAPSFFDYDAVVVEPASISRVIEQVLTRTEDHRTFADEPVLNEPPGPFVVGLADHLQRRRDETERLLAAGKLLVVFARPNVPHSHILGLPGYDRYAWLPAPPGVFYRPPHLLPADGRGVSLVDSAHPLSELVDRFQNWFTYRAYFSERLPAFPENGQVLMRSPGGAAIGVELRVGPGRIVFLPALEDVPSGDMRFDLAARVVAAVRRAGAGETEADAPRWTAGYTLPELERLEAEEREAERAAAEAQDRLTAARAAAAGLAGLRRLLWTEGTYQLEPAVREAFNLIGCEVDLDPDRPAVLRADGRTAFFEVQGSREAVGEDVYIRLQRRLEKDMLATGEPKKGIVVVNGRRRSRPEARVEPYTRALRVACENSRYTLLPTPVLFQMVQIALGSADPDVMRRLRDALFDSVGEIALDPSLAPPPAPTAAPAETEAETEAV
ncbi:MAG TPA: hypothetical protein VFA70_13345 [Dehalococcoidia bacterium]|nr:hypothetical protein [Dehalococcoidia bacterium]